MNYKTHVTQKKLFYFVSYSTWSAKFNAEVSITEFFDKLTDDWEVRFMGNNSNMNPALCSMHIQVSSTCGSELD